MSNIIPTNLDDFFSDNYAIYGASVLMDRAIPSINDGLLPVQRRILYTFFKEGEFTRFRKAAVFVGKTLLLHAHGDLSLYSSIVKLSQTFNKLNVFVDAQGNNGSVQDFDSFAAQRYLELKLSKFSIDTLFTDIDKNTTDFIPNYDKSIDEPVYLPSKFPMILNSGITGIGSGYATSIPPHSVVDICKTTIAKIKDKTLTSVDLAKIIGGPSFPTGGIITNTSQLPKIYADGQGVIKIQARFEKITYKNKEVLQVTELPYKVSTSKILDEINAIISKDDKHELNSVLQDVKNLTDKSTKPNKVNVIYIPKKNVDVEILKNVLLKYTSLSTSEKYIANVLYDHKFIVNASLDTILSNWIEYRQSTLKRKYNHLICQKTERLFILNALLKAQKNIDEVIALIRTSKGKQDVKEKLMEKYGFVEKEAEYIATLQLYRISSLEVTKLRDEIKNIKEEVDIYIEILSDTSMIDTIIIDELEECIKNYPSKRNTDLLNIASVTSDDVAKSTVEAEDLVISISTDGYLYSKASGEINEQHRGTKGSSIIPTKYKKTLEKTFFMHSHDDLYCFTDSGKLFVLPAYKLKVNHTHVNNIIPELKGSKIVEFLPVVKNTKGNLIFVTSGSFIKKTNIEEYNSSRMPSDGLLAIKLDEDEELIGVELSVNECDLILVTTSKGYCSKMPVFNIEESNRTTKGRRKIMLKDDEVCTSVVVANGEDEDKLSILILTENGKGKLTKISDLMYKKTETGISAAHKAVTLNPEDKLIKSKLISNDDEFIIVNTKMSKTIKLSTKDINTYSRTAKGNRIINLNDDDCVVNVI